MENEKSENGCWGCGKKKHHHPVVGSPNQSNLHFMIIGLSDEGNNVTDYCIMDLEQAQRFVDSVNRQWMKILDNAIAEKESKHA